MGKPKAKLHINNLSVLAHTVHTLSAHTNHIVVVLASGTEIPCIKSSISQLTWAFDHMDGEGPLRGFEAGFAALPNWAERVFVTGCDAPLLQGQLIAHLLAHPLRVDALIPVVTGHRQPLVGVYKSFVQETVQNLLGEGERSLQGLLRHIRVTEIHEPDLRLVDPTLLSFENMNTPDDYQRILSKLRLRT